MDVGDLCQRQVVTVGPNEELLLATQRMRSQHVGYLVVVESLPSGEGMRAVGVLTDRDIVVEVVAREADPHAFRVGDLMSREPVTIPESAPLSAALQTMRGAGVRRLPVVGSRGELAGVISIDDVLSELATQLRDVARSIGNEQHIEATRRP